MTERPDPPTDPGRVAGAAPREAGWRGIGPGRIERRMTLDEPEAHRLFLEVLERIARLSGFSAEVRVRGGEVVIRAETGDSDHDVPEPDRALDLILRLDLDRSEP